MRTKSRVAQRTGREFNVPTTKSAQTLQELCLDGFHVQLQRRGRWLRGALRHDRRRRGGNRRSSGLRHRRSDRRNRRLDRWRDWNLAWRFSGCDTSHNFWLWSVGKFDDDSRWQRHGGCRWLRRVQLGFQKFQSPGQIRHFLLQFRMPLLEPLQVPSFLIIHKWFRSLRRRC